MTFCRSHDAGCAFNVCLGDADDFAMTLFGGESFLLEFVELLIDLLKGVVVFDAENDDGIAFVFTIKAADAS